MRIGDHYSGGGSVVPVDSPVYLVQFWHDRDGGLVCADYELTDCAVDEVLAWARDHTPAGARAVVYACHYPGPGDPAAEFHLRLSGDDPSRVSGNSVTLRWE